jgi:hypothetical protein
VNFYKKAGPAENSAGPVISFKKTFINFCLLISAFCRKSTKKLHQQKAKEEPQLI